MSVSRPAAGNHRPLEKRTSARMQAIEGESRRGFRPETRAGEFSVVASLNRVSGRGIGKPKVRGRDAVQLHQVVGPCPAVDTCTFPVRNTVVPPRKPRTENAKPIDLRPDPMKPVGTPVEVVRGVDVQLTPVSRV